MAIVIATNGRAEYKTMKLSGPDRVVIDVLNARVRTRGRSRSLEVNNSGVQKVRWALFQLSPPIARVVVDLDNAMDFRIESRADAIVVHLTP